LRPHEPSSERTAARERDEEVARDSFEFLAVAGEVGDEPEPHRLVALDRLSGEDHFERLTGAYDSREPLRAAEMGQRSAHKLGERETRTDGGRA